jgi:hypothetical protein
VRRWAGLIAIACCVSGCQSLRFYPVCVVAGAAIEPDQFEQFRQIVLRAIGSLTDRSRPDAQLSSFGMYLRTHQQGHGRVRAHWPNLACLASEPSSPVTDQLYRTCQSGVARFISERRILWPGPTSHGLPTCDHPDVARASPAVRMMPAVRPEPVGLEAQQVPINPLEPITF